jgi:alpha-L-fucosidase
MKSLYKIILFVFFCLIVSAVTYSQSIKNETKSEYNARMQWWREARFGLFIHWGLYSVPAGEWNGKTEYGEWIRTSAQIPLDVYDQFRKRFHPDKFNADEWVQMAKDAGMKYITITTKHHDGFCLFDSKYTDFDVMSTPFQRDIMKELAEACQRQGITLCWYHSIMDWHHPDYLPRREWETNRSTENAQYDRYVQYMKNQLKELLTNYGKIGVLWFDGEWENTWNRERGRDLYNYVRSLQPDIIINNRVGAGRSGMEGFSDDEESAGDFGTPEQQVPATGIPGVNWETCLTMNDHWGYNNHDSIWKSSKELLHMLADIASKGGNFLLNVGPTSDGLFPQASIDRLHDIGRWMKINGESIYGTNASPFEYLSWGRCTQKTIGDNTRLYLHVFTYPANGNLTIPGIFNQPERVYLLADPKKQLLSVARNEDALVIHLPIIPPDTINTVVVLDLPGKADISKPPKIDTELNIFIDTMLVAVTSERENIEIRCTTDGSLPSLSSPKSNGSIPISETTTISARCFRNGQPVSGISQAIFTKVVPKTTVIIDNPKSGLTCKYYEGNWDSLPDFRTMTPIVESIVPDITIDPRERNEYFGMHFDGYIHIPTDGVYTFYTASDDGSTLSLDDTLVVHNDGLHGTSEAKGITALAGGYHHITIQYFNKTGGKDLKISFSGPGIIKKVIPNELFFHQ